MQKLLVDLMRGGRMARWLAGPLGALAVVLFGAWMIYTIPPKAPAEAGIPSPSAQPCSDGNAVDGDCCSADGFQEESRFGFVVTSDGYVDSRAVECVTDGLNHCEDGIDNDGDGLIDAEDPECATLNDTLRQVIIGNNQGARYSVRTGSEVRIRHQEFDGSNVDPADFWMPATCDDSGTCACPDTFIGGDPNDPNTPGLPRPACQTQGLACDTDFDCEPSQYPGAASHAAICGHTIQLKREGVFEGNVVARGNIRLGRGFVGSRNLGVLGGQFFCDGCVLNPSRNAKRAPFPNLILDGESWWAGPGLCIPSGTESCYADADCSIPGDLCDARLQLDFLGINPNGVLTGGTLDPNDPFSTANDFDRCVAAMEALGRFSDPNDPGRLTGDNLSGTPIGQVKIAGLQSVNLDFSGTNTTFVRDIDLVNMGRQAQLRINAHSTSTVVLRVLDRFRVGARNLVSVGPDPLDPNDPGITPDRVLWLFDGVRGKISTTQSSQVVGTMLAPNRRTPLIIGSGNTYTGALFSGVVDVGGASIVNHRPFTGLLPTNLSVEKTVEADPSNPHQYLLGPDAVAAGEDLIYTITVRNNGPSWAPGVVLTDLLPADGLGDDLVSVNSYGITQGNGSCEHVPLPGEADRIVCYLGTLNREDDPDTAVIDNEATIEIRVTVNADVRGVITNTASVAGNIEEGFPANNTDTADITVVGISDLVVTKDDSPDPAVAGEASALTYTITVDNLGPSDAFDALPSGVLLLDVVPANLSIISATHHPGDGGAPQACNVSGQNVTCEMGRIDVDDPVEVIEIVVTPACNAHLTHPPVSPLSNAAVVTNPGGEIDPDGFNNTDDTTTGFVGEVDLTTEKTDNPDYAIAGQQVVYTVTVTNHGPSEASQVTFADTLPAGTALNEAASPLCQITGGTAFVNQTIECTVGQVFCPTDGGNTANVSFTVDIDSSVPDNTIITNNVTSVSRFETETAPGNDGSSEDTLIRRLQGLAIEKTKSDPAGNCVPGETVTYTLVARNYGPSDADDAEVTDTFDANLSGCTWACVSTGDANCDAANGAGSINTTVDIAADSTGLANFVTITATCTIDPGMRGTLENTANIDVAPLSLPDPFTDDNESLVACTLDPRADLSLVKEVTGSDPAVAGETSDVQYRVTVTNLGPSHAQDGSGVSFTDVLPAGAQFVSINPSQGSCDAAPSGGSIGCALGAINAGDSVTVDIVMTADCDTRGIITNTASAVTDGEADPNSPNTTSVDLAITGEVDLTTSQEDSVTLTPGYVIAGESMQYIVTVANAGPSDANNVTFIDTLPAGVSFVSGANCSDIGGGQVQCSISNISCGASAQRTMTVAVASSVAESAVLTNSVGTLVRDETEQDGSNDGSNHDTTARRQTNLGIAKTKTAPVGNCVPGMSVSYQLVVTNAGPSDTTGATVTDAFDSNLTCTWTCSSTGSASCGNANGAGSISELVNIAAGGGNSVTFNATCTIDPGMRGTLTNVGNVAIEAGTLADPTPFNNESSVPCTLVPSADLVLGKVITSGPNATPGVVGGVVYTITVTNNGPSHAQDGNVTVIDPLPVTGGAAATLVSALPSQGSCSGTSTLTCNLGDIDSGANATVVVTMTSNCASRGAMANAATATTGPGGEADPGSPNGTLVAGPTLIASVSRSLGASASTETPNFVVQGDPLTYTFTAQNDGPSDALTSVLTINFSPSFTPGAAPVGCSHPGGAGGTGTCNLGALDCAADGVDSTVVWAGTVTGAAVLGSTSEVVTTASLTSAEGGSEGDSATTDIRIPQGQSCLGGTNPDCTTGACVGDAGGTVCCDNSCAGACRSCIGSETGGVTGTCGNILDDTDPNNECAADGPGGCGFDGFCGGPNDAGSGIDRSGQCGYIQVGTQCTDTAPPSSTNQALNCKDAQCTGSGVCDQNFTNEANGTICNDDIVNTNPDTCVSGTCVGQVHVDGIPPDKFVFVSTTGSNTVGCGTRIAPCQTISFGLTRAIALTATDVCVAGGTYNESVTLVSGINLRGGFIQASDWLAGGPASVINATSNLSAIGGTSVNNVLVRDFTINGASSSGTNSTYAVRLISSSGITLQNNTINAGNMTAAPAIGATGTVGATGGNGVQGGAGHCDSDSPGAAGGAGGTSSCARAGGAGGGGGYGENNGGGGSQGQGPGGTGGPGGGWGNPGGNGTAGNPGTSGTGGSQGAGAAAGGSLSGNLWVSNSGSVGTSGTHGTGGGGGGGGGGQSCSICTSGRGTSGGGGGAGGCLGTFGAVGVGGGGSFGVFLVDSSVSFTGNSISAGTGATGGAGGFGGGGGGAGSPGGGGPQLGDCNGQEVGFGASGAFGGAGGGGGRGGGGAGGPSIAIRCFGTSSVSGSSSCTAGSAGAGGAPNGPAGQSSAVSVGCGADPLGGTC